LVKKYLVEIGKRDGYLFADFRGNGIVYKIPETYEKEVVDKIKKEIERYRGIKRKLIEEASALGVIIIPTTIGGDDPYFLELKQNIEKILKKYAIERYSSLENYMK
jgi:hypothetical protein